MAPKPYFEIFKKQLGGIVLWVDIAGILKDAIEKARKAVSLDPVPHVIVNSRTGEKTAASPNDH